MRVSILAISLLLSACATSAQQASVSLDAGLSALVGQPVDVAFAQFGPPIASASMGAETIYGWGHAFTSTELMTPTPGFIDAAESQGGIFPPPRRTVQNDCVIRMVAGADGLIRDWDYHGNDRGCRFYADRLAESRLPAGG